MGELLCESCGKNIMDKTGQIMAGLRLTIKIPEDASEDEVEFVGLQYGKYFNRSGIDICLCMECFLDSAFPNHNPYL